MPSANESPVPSLSDAYRVRLTRRRVRLPAGCAGCGAALDEAPERTVSLDELRTSSFPSCLRCQQLVGEMRGLQGALLMTGAVLALAGTAGVRALGVHAPLAVFLGGWAPGLAALALQPRLAPLTALPGSDVARAAPVQLRRRRSEVVLRVQRGAYAAALARDNGAVPEPVAGAPAWPGPGLGLFEGPGLELAVELALVSAVWAALQAMG